MPERTESLSSVEGLSARLALNNYSMKRSKQPLFVLFLVCVVIIDGYTMASKVDNLRQRPIVGSRMSFTLWPTCGALLDSHLVGDGRTGYGN